MAAKFALYVSIVQPTAQKEERENAAFRMVQNMKTP
jgi:hypothetical protein